jgi:hypothetical protein
MKPNIKTLVVVAILALGMHSNADTIERLTSTNDTYRASLKGDTVYYNIVGKTALSRTNLTGWLNLKTNLLTAGYLLKVERPITSNVTPWVGGKTDNLTEVMIGARQQYENNVAAQERERKAAAVRAMKQRALNDPKLREAAIAAWHKSNEDEKVSQGLATMKEGRNVRLP